MEFSKKNTEDDFLVLAGIVEEDPFRNLKVVEEEEEHGLQPPKKTKKSVAFVKNKTRKKTPKRKPPSVKNFFSTVKNSQGFDMHLCRYEPSIRDYVYVPRKYHQLTKAKLWIDRTKFCSCCKLQPCITVEHAEEIAHKACEVFSAHEKALQEGKRVKQQTPVTAVERFIVSLMNKYFGREYMKRNGTPECVITEACQWHQLWKKDNS